ncbi:1-phosphofructokinase family hexose kinase [Brachybacterium alimentarium]|uniref:1-phosphofructokinase family hexose kinase n=1 Tax=Brachybacterium alimentarium TaxID=47845 RepID=UPI000DF3C21F|nr:hexose kinase [Brachybacterium alimentarium]RCS93451.1 1-phosphofructokinase [Brachybacterium alimentarium]
MIVVLTPNPAVDVTYCVAKQQIGVTQRVLTVLRHPGGKGINVSRILTSHGADTLCVLPLAGETGRWISREAQELGQSVRPVWIDGESRTTTTIVDDLHHPTMYGEPGPDADAAQWRELTAVIEETLEGADALVISGSLPPGVPATMVGTWVSAARRAGVLSLVDVSGKALLAAARAGADICKPNREELQTATGCGDVADAAAVLLEAGAGCVVVSAGHEGIEAYGLDGLATSVSAVPEVTGNPTGAGDAATAGLLLAWLDGQSLRECLTHAAAFGAAAVLRPVAGEVDDRALARFLTDTPITER